MTTPLYWGKGILLLHYPFSFIGQWTHFTTCINTAAVKLHIVYDLLNIQHV